MHQPLKRTLLLFLALSIAAPVISQDAHAKRKHVRDAIVAGAVGVAIGAALSHRHKHREDVYYPGYQPRYPADGYDAYWNSSFSPAPGQICYNAQRLCYDANGSVAHKATFTYYGR